MSLDISSNPSDRQDHVSQSETPAATPDVHTRRDHASLTENDAFLAALYARPRNRTPGRPS